MIFIKLYSFELDNCVERDKFCSTKGIIEETLRVLEDTPLDFAEILIDLFGVKI